MADKETIDIEALLVRAYRDYAVDRVTPERVLGIVKPTLGYVSNAAVVARHLALGVAVDRSPAAANILGCAANAASVPNDMLDLHDAVLALDDCFIERAGADCMVWDEATAAQAGCDIFRRDGEWFIQRNRRGTGEDEPPVRRLERVNTSVLVILHARAGTRPFVDELEVEQVRPVYRGARKAAAAYERVYVTAPEVIAVQRAEYQTWHCALGLLAAQLRDLASVAVTGPDAPLAPWENADAQLDKPLEALGFEADEGARRPGGA